MHSNSRLILASLIAAAVAGQHLRLAALAEGARDDVEQVLSLAREACFVRGGDITALKELADSGDWEAAPPSELAKHATPYTKMVGGWTFTKNGMATAVLQSAFLPPRSGTVCSITTMLSSDVDHQRVKRGFAQLFGTIIAEETDNPSRHVDRYWIDRGQVPPVKSTIVFEKAKRALTVRMVHGSALPTQS